MYTNKKEVDAHVRSAMSKLRSETERRLRSFTIAKLYFRVNEFPSAEQYILSYLHAKEDNEQAHKMLGQCYQRMQKPEKALQSYQRSLQLNSRQPDVLIEVCKLLNDEKSFNPNKAKYWCELAESEKVQNDAVFTLRLKLMNKDNLGTNQVEDLIQKEITIRPNDVQLRVRLVRTYIEQNRILDAFTYVYNFEMKQRYEFSNSGEWYNAVWLVLNKYELLSNAKKDWEFWLLLIMCLERQVNLSFTMASTSAPGGITETANLLFNFDQYLFKISQLATKLSAQKELVQYFLNHYRGQLLLHAASLIFKREILQNKKKWKETTTAVLPLLLLAYQVEKPDSKEPWMMHCDEQGKQLLQLWSREGSFRCCQVGRTLLSCIEEVGDTENMSQHINSVLGTQPVLWSSYESLINQIRQTCADKQWRRNVFALLFCNSDQKVKEQTSMLIKCTSFAEPKYELPIYADLEHYEEQAQYLKPQSLSHMVYLCLGNDNLALVRNKFFSGLNFSTANLSFCGAESLNQLDVETFMYAATIQAKRIFQVERETFESFHAGDRQASAKPRILPFVNLHAQLCTEEQANWWWAAYQVYKNLKSDSPAETRANLQFGIEAVRGINSPKIDMIIVFKLGKIFVKRAQDIVKPVDKSMLEARAESIYKYGLNMMKMHNKGVLEPFRKYFKYAKANTTAVEGEVIEAAEDGVAFLANRYFKKSEYEDLIEEFSGVQLPFATYLQAEAYRKLDEANKTPKSAKRMYLERASECLSQTLSLLKSTQTDPNHPLNSIIHSELKRVQQSTSRLLNNADCFSPNSVGVHNNSSTYEDAEGDLFADTSFIPGITAHANNRSRRDSAGAAAAALQNSLMRNSELESLIKQMSSTLTFLKDEVVSMHTEVSSLKDKVGQLEESMKKTRISSNPQSRDDASNVLEDLYMIEDALQNQLYPQAQQSTQQQQQTTHNMFQNVTASVPMGNLSSPFAGPQHQQQQQPRIHTPNAMQMTAAFGSPMFNPNYPLPYYTPPYMMTPQGQPPATASLLGNQRNPLGMSPFVDPTTMNFNMASNLPQLTMPQNQDARSNNLYSLLNQGQNSTVPQQPQTQPQLPTFSMPSMVNNVANNMTNNLTSSPAMQFNKALNNQPVEKGPPANVVITSSDPLPNPNVVTQQTQQPTLSVTIPSHHIKSSLIQPNEAPATQTSSTNMSGFSFGLSSGSSVFSSMVSNSLTTITAPQIAKAPSTAMFQVPTTKESQLNRTADSIEHNKSQLSEKYEEEEYDPRPDFKPIIPLPDEVPVVTGEEDDEVIFAHHAKLYRMVEKEWKERGSGDIKILKTKDGYSRIVMRRDRTHKICANHKITRELIITTSKNETKGYIWAAQDFADEELKTEKFFVRFKLPETAKEFYEAFKKAQREHDNLEKQTDNEQMEPPTATTKIENKPTVTFALSKSSVANFATSTPANKQEVAKGQTVLAPATSTMPNVLTTAIASSTTVSKSLFSGANLPAKSAEQPKQGTTSPFANFTFDKPAAPIPVALPISAAPTTTTSPFANLFSNIGKSNQSSPFAGANLPNLFQSPIATVGATPPTSTTISTTTFAVADSSVSKSNTSDAEDDYVPTAEFKPVIPLPELIELKTDEENDIILFEYRAKLLRYDKEAGEWKERGIGKVKLLQNRDDVNQVRMIMRREQVHKLCCNQLIKKNTVFKYAKNSQTALTWAGHDYLDNELITEMLSLRFKTPEICKQFLETILAAQSKMSADDEGALQDTEAETNPTEEKKIGASTGFGDKFKPKVGSWSCTACYISNTPEKQHCVACDSPKNDTVPKKDTISNLSTTGKSTFSFGFAAADTSAKPPTATTAKPSFTFGITPASSSTEAAPATPTITTVNANATPTGNGFGNQFKPKIGSWSCDGCYLSNTAETLYCNACNSPKDNTVPAKDTTAQPKNLLALSNPEQKFSFGFAAANTPENKGANASSAPKLSTIAPFSFGTPTATKSEPTKPMFANLGNVGAVTENSKTFTFAPPTATSTAIVSASSSNSSIQKETFSFTLHSKAMEPSADGKFSFSLKPKSPGKSGKSPLKTGYTADGDDDVADDGDYHEEEENNTYFTPVIPLPDKIDVKTGEEDEDLLYSHRAKLYRYVEHEWKERGVGDVKILRHKETKKLRVVMRRDIILKLCLNHALNDSVKYTAKDEKAWQFLVNDFSEGAIELEQLALRFKTKEIAEGFMTAVKAALDGSANVITPASANTTLNTSANATTPTTLTTATNEFDKKLCEKLHLPDDFFLPKPSCKGCIGCEPDKFEFPMLQSNESFLNADDKDVQLPMNMPVLTLPKPNRSFLKQSALSPAPKSATNLSMTNKLGESMFSGFGGATNSPNFSSGGNTDKPSSNIAFSFATASNNTIKNEQPGNTGGSLFGGSIFGGTLDNKPIFGQSTPSIFGNVSAIANVNNSFGSGQSIFSANTTQTTPSIFGDKTANEIKNDANATTIFGDNNTNDKENKKLEDDNKAGIKKESKSIFGGTGSANVSGSIFSGSGGITGGTIFGMNPVFASGTPLFGNQDKTNDDASKTTDGQKSIFGSQKTTASATGDNGVALNNSNNLIFGGKTTTSFADLAAKLPTLTIQNSLFGNAAGAGGTLNSSNNSVFNIKQEKTSTTSTENTTTAIAPPTFAELSNKPGVVDFASLAANAKANDQTNAPADKPGPGGFIGLTNQQDAFSTFRTPDKKNGLGLATNNDSTKSADDGGDANDENYDPHYEPIIELPNEIAHSTGEENETKLFGERAVLYRYDDTNKEWKERGVGELKILLHPEHQTYRIVMRREQVYKLVLNQSISADLSIKNMNNSPKSYVWGTLNFAENPEGEYERLAIRFKKVELAQEFRGKLEECIDALKKRQETTA